jgi:glyoxylase-like metal-dependent hydrolase (beta-lactamase superfamily II)
LALVRVLAALLTSFWARATFCARYTNVFAFTGKDIDMTPPSMRVGDVEVQGLSDGVLQVSLDIVVGMERTTADQLLGGTENGSFYIPVNNFLIRRGGRTILIDAGAGNTMQPTLGKLHDNLRAAGVDPSVVTNIVLTHLHPDHANGLVDDAGAPRYPNAEIAVHEIEADFWMGPDGANDRELIKANRARTKINLRPYRERVRRVRDGEEYLDFTPVLAPGHTPGHTCWLLATSGGGFMAFGDVAHISAIQLSHPDTAVVYDLDKNQAIASRKRILDMAASEQLAIAGAHVNAPGLGYVVRKGAGYAFETAG